MNKIAVLKRAVNVTVGFGVSKIVNDFIARNVEPEHAYQKVTVPVAAFAIGGAVADASSKYTDAFIDDMVDVWNKMKANKSAK